MRVLSRSLDTWERNADLSVVLNSLLRPTLGNAIVKNRTCSELFCELSYETSYDGYGDPSIATMRDYINRRTRPYFQSNLKSVAKTGN